MKIADRIAFEFLSFRRVALYLWQPGYAMPLQTAMQRRTRQMWDRWLQSLKAVIQRQQRMTPESCDHRFLISAQNCGPGFSRTSLAIFQSLALAPLGNRFDIDPEVPAQRRVRRLYLSSKLRFDCRAGDRCIAARTACVPSRQICYANRLPGNSTRRCHDEFVP